MIIIVYLYLKSFAGIRVSVRLVQVWLVQRRVHYGRKSLKEHIQVKQHLSVKQRNTSPIVIVEHLLQSNHGGLVKDSQLYRDLRIYLRCISGTVFAFLGGSTFGHHTQTPSAFRSAPSAIHLGWKWFLSKNSTPNCLLVSFLLSCWQKLVNSFSLIKSCSQTGQVDFSAFYHEKIRKASNAAS